MSRPLTFALRHDNRPVVMMRDVAPHKIQRIRTLLEPHPQLIFNFEKYLKKNLFVCNDHVCALVAYDVINFGIEASVLDGFLHHSNMSESIIGQILGHIDVVGGEISKNDGSQESKLVYLQRIREYVEVCSKYTHRFKTREARLAIYFK